MKISQEQSIVLSVKLGGAATWHRSSRLLAVSCLVALCSSWGIAQTALNPPRWEVHYTKVYTEGETVGPGTGILLGGGTSIVTDPALMIGTGPSIRLDNTGNNANIATNPDVWPLAPNTTYILELQYRVVNRGSNTSLLGPILSPTNSDQQQVSINMPSLYANAAASGTFSSGAMTNSSPSYQLNVDAGPGVSIIIGNIVIYRQDTVQTTAPPAWSGLDTLPFPRLGAWYTGNPDYAVSDGTGGVPPYYYTLDQIENNLAFADVIVGFDGTSQTLGVDSIRRLRQLNPTAAILRGHPSEDVNLVPPPNNGFVNLGYQFRQGIADPWYVRDSHGNYLFYAGASFRLLNMTPYCPTVNGQSYDSYLAAWMTGNILSSGLWDGFWSDDLFAVINPHISTRFNPAALDADYNANGIRDETPAAVSDWMRSGLINVLQSVRDRIGDTELLTGNTGPEPQIPLAPYVNGYVQECTNCAWDPTGNGPYVEAGWRRVFDAYRTMQATVRHPAVNLFSGYSGSYSNYAGTYVTPSDADIARARMVLGTALLDDGFFHYSLCCPAAPPAWFDEMTVDGNGVAVQDRRYKGYLGAALSSATELASGGAVLFQQDFEAGPLPPSLSASGTVYVSNDPNEIISGQGSLVLSNPDHTKPGTVTISTVPGAIQLTPGQTSLVRLDFRVLETLDVGFSVTLCGDKACTSTKDYSVNIVKGDRGTINLPLTVASAAANWTLTLAIYDGGGKLAVDNLRVLEGGAGPWRRDFENGLVLVNPLNTPHTFSATDLAGVFHRTGIHRIKGTQAPDINTGESVTGSLTLGAFDAIILLADRVNVPGCSYALNYSAQAFAAQGGIGTINVSTEATCPWNVGALPAGITLTSGGVGVGPGIVTFQVLPNTGGAAFGSFTIADQTFSIEQVGQRDSRSGGCRLTRPGGFGGNLGFQPHRNQPGNRSGHGALQLHR